MTFYYTNQQSARLMFYHDHAYGITRLNVYAGEAAGYLRAGSDRGGARRGDKHRSRPTQIPLVIEDKTFVPSPTQLAAEDPTWDTAAYGGYGNLWFPHVYMTNQNPSDISGANADGPLGLRPVVLADLPDPDADGPEPALHHARRPEHAARPARTPFNPGIANPSIVPESFMDTMTVNGTAYPTLSVGQQSVPLPHPERLERPHPEPLAVSRGHRDGRQLRCRATGPSGTALHRSDDDRLLGEVPMVPAVQGGAGTAGYIYPDQLDGRDRWRARQSGPAGPDMWQIGTEGGFLSNAVDLPNGPVGYNYNRRDIVVLNISNRNLTLGPAERADVVVDFSGVAGRRHLILYNDTPGADAGLRHPLRLLHRRPGPGHDRRRPDDAARLRPEHPDRHADPGHRLRHGASHHDLLRPPGRHPGGLRRDPGRPGRSRAGPTTRRSARTLAG